MVDVVAWMLKSFSNRDYVFVKMAIEGAEQGILRRLLSEKRGDIIDLMAWQCHQSKDAADTSCRDLDADLMRETKIMTIKDQTQAPTPFLTTIEDNFTFCFFQLLKFWASLSLFRFSFGFPFRQLVFTPLSE